MPPDKSDSIDALDNMDFKPAAPTAPYMDLKHYAPAVPWWAIVAFRRTQAMRQTIRQLRACTPTPDDVVPGDLRFCGFCAEEIEAKGWRAMNLAIGDSVLEPLVDFHHGK